MRSFLFVPADSEKKLAKGAGSGADALIVDLEDSVALSNKEAARKSAVAYLKTAGRAGPKLVLRINALDTPFWEADLEAVVPAKPDMIVVPKTISGACVKKVGDRIDRLGGGDIGIGCVAIGTAALALRSGSRQPGHGAHPASGERRWLPPVASTTSGARRREAETTAPVDGPARSGCSARSRPDVAPIDGIYRDFRDEAGLEAGARAAIRRRFHRPKWRSITRRSIIRPGLHAGRSRPCPCSRGYRGFRESGRCRRCRARRRDARHPHLKQAKALLTRAAQAN